ncbi:MAG: DUF5675 family protein [Prevotellaceae bacterium]|jgi:hypothetical protein|nr:DUF5675 family protein [Prevotellaceae bacterium]
MNGNNITVDEEIYDPFEKTDNMLPQKEEETSTGKEDKPVTGSSGGSVAALNENEENVHSGEGSGKTTPETGAYLVCKGALCKCDKGAAPGRLKITSHSKYYINDASGEKLVATVADVQFEEPAFGTCAAKNNSKCKPAAIKWEVKAGDEHPVAGGNKILTDNGKLTCTAGGGKIEILAHGQVQSVSSVDMDDYSAGIENAVNCLASSESAMEEKEKKEKAASVYEIVYNEKKSSDPKSINIAVRKGEQVTFEATGKTTDSNKEYDPGLVNWAVCTREGRNETIPKLKSGNPCVYAHWGDKFRIAFNKAGFYFIEAFGSAKRLESDYKYSEKDSKNCVFQIEALESNEITGIKGFGSIEDGYYITQYGSSHAFEIETLLPLNDEELELLCVKIFDENNHCMDIISKQNKFSYTFKNDGKYYIRASLGENKKEFTVGTVGNEVVGITPARTLVRPEETVEFTAKLKYDKNINTNKLEWYLGEECLIESSATCKISFGSRKEKDYILKAWIPFLLLNRKLAATLKLTVSKCRVADLRTENSKTVMYAGKTVEIKAFTNFSDYSSSRDGETAWTANLSPSADAKGVIPSCLAVFEFAEGKPGEEKLSNIKLAAAFKAGRTVRFTPYCPGEYAFSASLNGSVKNVTVKVEQAEIVRWCFTDSADNRRSETGWGQSFNIAIEVRGWENLKAKVRLQIDMRNRNSQFVALKCSELENEIAFDARGRANVTVKDSALWGEIAEKVTALKIGKNVRLFFTVEQMPIICKNQRNYDAKHGLCGQVFPEVSGEAGRTLDIVAKTAYSGFFADGGGELLKRIVKYGEPAQARICVMPNKKDAEKTDDYEFAVSLIENLKGEDTVCVDKEPQTPDAEEGIISMKIDTEAFDKEKHAEIAGSDFLPRVFYFILYCRHKKDREYKPVYIYPEEYGINRRNDSNIIELKDDSAGEADKANEEKLKNRRNYFLQLKVAKETLLNRSLSNAAPVVIGEPLEKKETANDVDPQKIIIEVSRIKHNSVRTIGTFKISANGEVKTGYTLERDGMPEEMETVGGKCKRIRAGTYDFEITTWSDDDTKIGTTLRILDVPGRSGILFHGGNVYSNSEGCILGNKKEPVEKKDNTYKDSCAFVLEIVEFVRTQETKIKEKYNLQKVEKKIIITQSEEKKD